MAAMGDIRAGKAYVEVGANNAGLAAGLRAAEAKVKAFGDGMRAMGMQTMALGGAMMAPFAMATGAYVNFEKTMARVRGLTRASGDEFGLLTAEAKRLGEQTEYSASEAAQMMAEFAQRGFKVNQILTASGPALAMATAGTMQLGEAAGIASDIMNGMQLNATKLGDVADIMTVAFQSSATDLRQLGEAFKYVGPDALQAGMSLEEITAAIMLLSDAGIKADMAGTTLRGGLQSLINPSNEAKATLERLGVSIRTEDGRFRKFDAIVADLTTGLEKLSEVDAAQAIGEIFTNRQATGFAVLTRRNKETGQTGAEALREKTASLGPEARKGAAFGVQQSLLQTLWGGWKLIESAVEGVGITIGEILAPTIRGIAEDVIWAVGIFHDLVKANKEWVPVIAKTAAIVIGVGTALVGVGTAAGVVAFAVGGIASAFSAVAGVIGAVSAGPVLAVAAGVWLVISAVSEMGLTWEGMTPILKAYGGYVLAAVAVTVGTVYGAIEVIKQVGKALGQAAMSFGTWLQQTFPAQMKALSDGFGSIVGHFGKFWDDMAGTATKSWGGIVDAIKGGEFELAGEIAMKGFQVAWKQGQVFLMDSWRRTLGFFHDKWLDAWRDISLGINNIWYGIERVLFEGFASIYRAWGWLMDTMNRQMAGASAAWTMMQEGMKLGITFGLKFREKVEAKALEVQNQLKGDLDKIKQAREDEIKKEFGARGSIEDRQKADEKKINDSAAAQKAAFAAETKDQLQGPTAELGAAMLELDDAIKKVADKRTLKELGGYLLPGAMEIMKAAKETGVGSQSAIAAAERAGGPAVGPTPAAEVIGTFDSAMIRFLGDTSGDSLERRQLREQEAQVALLKQLIEAVKGLVPLAFK